MPNINPNNQLTQVSTHTQCYSRISQLQLVICQDNIYQDIYLPQINEYQLIFESIIIVIGVIIGIYISSRLLNRLNLAILKLVKSIEQVQQLDACQLSDNYPCLELKQFSKSINKLYLYLQICSDNYYNCDETTQLIRYSQAIEIFEQLQLQNCLGIACNNIANIHLKEGRFEEALNYYEQAVEVTKRELQQLLDTRNLTQFYRFEVDFSDDDAGQALNQQENTKVLVNIKRKAELDQILCNRCLQLANARILIANQLQDYHKDTWRDIINLLDTVVNVEPSLVKPNTREINTLIKLAEAYLIYGDLPRASTTLDYAETALEEYQEIYKLFPTNEPPDVLWQRTYLARGRIMKALYSEGVVTLRNLVRCLTRAITHGRIYDPYVRIQALIELTHLFEEKELSKQYSQAQKQLIENQRHRHKDLVYLIEYSRVMGLRNRIDRSIGIVLNIFDQHLKENDRVGLIKYNDNIEVVMKLTNYNDNNKFTRNSIQNLIKQECDGGAALLNAIYEGVNTFIEQEQIDQQRWLLLFTSGIETSSVIDYLTLADYLRSHLVNMIIIGVDVSPEQSRIMQQFCQQINQSSYLPIDDIIGLELILQGMSNNEHANNYNLIVETFN